MGYESVVNDRGMLLKIFNDSFQAMIIVLRER